MKYVSTAARLRGVSSLRRGGASPFFVRVGSVTVTGFGPLLMSLEDGSCRIGEHSICGTTCKHARPLVGSPRDIDRRGLGFSTCQTCPDRESSTVYLACHSARTILPFLHHAPWTAEKRKAQPPCEVHRSGFIAGAFLDSLLRFLLLQRCRFSFFLASAAKLCLKDTCKPNCAAEHRRLPSDSAREKRARD